MCARVCVSRCTHTDTHTHTHTDTHTHTRACPYIKGTPVEGTPEYWGKEKEKKRLENVYKIHIYVYIYTHFVDVL